MGVEPFVFDQDWMQTDGHWAGWHSLSLPNFDLVWWHFKTGISEAVGFSLKPFHAHAREVTNEWGFLLRQFFDDGIEQAIGHMWWLFGRCSRFGNRCNISTEAAAEIVARHAHRDRLERLK